MTYRAGIIGCGRIGCSFDDDTNRGYISSHAGGYVNTPGFELVALADVDRTRLDCYGEKFRVTGRYEDHREMLTRERLDVVSICTWNHTHRQLVEDAVAAGVRAIFCEKPIAESLDSADAIIRRCRNAGVLLLVDHQRRFDRFHREVASFLRAGRLGRIQQVSAFYTAGIANTGTHLLDLLRFFFGNADWVQGMSSANASPNPNDPNIDGWIHFSSEVLASLHALDVNAFTIFELTILGTESRLRITNHGFGVQFEQARNSHRFAGYRELYPADSPISADGKHEFMLQAMCHLLDCLNTGQQPVSSGEDGRAALELICALRQSAEQGSARVPLPLLNSHITIQSR